MNKKWIVSCYNNDIAWIDNFTSNYIIYDKAGSLPESDRVKHVPNVGLNIYDYSHFIVENYNSLPDVCVFLKGNIFNRKPEPHCNEERFKVLIENNTLTPLESYEHIPVSHVNIKGDDGGYCERSGGYGGGCWGGGKYENGICVSPPPRYFTSYNQFLDLMFINPVYPEFMRFAPGANYIVPKQNILFYSRNFYQKLINFVEYDTHSQEIYIIERALFTIFKNLFRERT